MSQVYMLAPINFPGSIVEGPSSRIYKIVPEEVVTIDLRDQLFFLRKGFTAAPPSADAVGGSLTIIGNGGTVTGVTSVDFDISATVSGTTPNAVVEVAASPVLRVVASISSAQILAGLVTPVSILPAPGAGKVYNVMRSFYSYEFNTIAYQNVGGVGGGLYYGTPAQLNTADGGDSLVPTLAASGFAAPSNFVTVLAAAANNAPLVYGLAADTGASAYTLGNGTMTLTVDYTINSL